MKKVLFKSYNLIGDGLYISPALNAWWKQHRDEYDLPHFMTHHNFIAPMYESMKVPLVFVSEPQGPYDFEFNFDVNEAFRICDAKKMHIAEAYAEMLGVELPIDPGYVWGHVNPIFEPDPEVLREEEKGLLLVSAFSASCASREGKPPNKMLPWYKWEPILRYLRSLAIPIRFLGSDADRFPNFLEIRSEEYMTAVPLNRLAQVMREAKLIVTLDNGMSHLAASQSAPTFLFYPACLGLHYILPKGNRFCSYVHMDPVHVSTAQIILQMRRVIPLLLGASEPIANNKEKGYDVNQG